MSRQELQNIVNSMEDIIYPEVIQKEPSGYVNARMEDMVCFFYMKSGPTEKIYLKQQMETILEECGCTVCGCAFKNYRRDLTLSIHYLLYKGKNDVVEIALVSGSHNMGAILFCSDLLEEIKRVYGSDYVIVAVLERGLVLIKSEENISIRFLKRIHEEIRAEMKEMFLTECFFLYKEGKLTKIKEM